MPYTGHITVDGIRKELRDNEAVSFVQEQTLTDAQKAKARTNIGAADSWDVSDLKSQYERELTWTSGGYIKKANGELSASGNFSYTEYMELHGVPVLIGNAFYVPSDGCYAAFYDADFAFLGASIDGDGAQKRVNDALTVPAGAKYIRLCNYNSQTANIKLYVYISAADMQDTLNVVGGVFEHKDNLAATINKLPVVFQATSTSDSVTIYNSYVQSGPYYAAMKAEKHYLAVARAFIHTDDTATRGTVRLSLVKKDTSSTEPATVTKQQDVWMSVAGKGTAQTMYCVCSVSEDVSVYFKITSFSSGTASRSYHISIEDVCLFEFDTEDDALAFAARVDFGLSVYGWTSAVDGVARQGVELNRSKARYYEQTGNRFLSLADFGMTKGAYLSTAGVKVNNADHWTSDYIPVYAGMEFEYRLSAGSGLGIICAYGSESEVSFISCVTGGGYSVAKTGEYTVPDGANYIRVCSLIWDDATDSALGSHVQGPFFRVAGSVAEEKRPNIYDYKALNARSGYYVKATDGLLNSTSATYTWATPNYIKVKKDDLVRYALYAPSNGAAIAYYDKYKTFVRTALQGQGNSSNYWLNGYLIIPDGVEYIRVCYSTSYETPYTPLLELVNYPLIRATEFQYAKKAVANAKKYRSGREPFSLLHFTDVHGTGDSIENVVRFWSEQRQYVDDAVCTGDLVKATSEDGMAFWDNVDGAEDILITVGNHDQVLNGETMTQAQQYALYIAPYASHWGATTVTGKTWWYKDYTDCNVRLIGLGSTYIMQSEDLTAMNTWLSGVLADAKTNGLAVVIAEHYPPEDPVAIAGAFTQQDWTPSGIALDDSVLDVVDTFINGGGEFVCYVCGHTHQDQLLYSANHPNQIFVVATTASTAAAQQAFSDLAREAALDIAWAYNILSVDTNSKHIRLIRVGADMTMRMEKRECMVINYATKTVVSENGIVV